MRDVDHVDAGSRQPSPSAIRAQDDWGDRRAATAQPGGPGPHALAEQPPAAPAAEDPSPESETVSDVQPDLSVQRQRQMMLEHRAEILQAADEQTFSILNVPDAQRTAIRAIDSAYAYNDELKNLIYNRGI